MELCLPFHHRGKIWASALNMVACFLTPVLGSLSWTQNITERAEKYEKVKSV